MARRRRSWIPWLFPAGMLPVLLANAALIWYALASAPALVVEHAFEDGKSYNREIAAAAAQQALGWSAALAIPGVAAKAGEVSLTVKDGSGRPVGGLQVVLRAWRPVGNLPDMRTPLLETEPGRYTASLGVLQPGQWQLDLVARRGTAEYAIGRRIVIR